jgi:hypothetical protein
MLAQRQGGPAPAAAPSAAPTADQAPTPASGTSAAALIRDDDAADVRPGQLTRSVFLDRLRAAVGDAAQRTLSGIPGAAVAQPAIDEQIEQQLAAYRDQDGPGLERAIRQQVPAAVTAASAQDLIDAVTQKVGQDVADHGPGSGGAPQARAGAPGVLFSAREGGARDVDDPAAIQAQLQGGQSLDGSVRSGMETAFGQSFSDVRVHSDATAIQLAEDLNARAFAVGRDIAFGAGEYRPGTLVGDALIAHELAHVAQQGGNPTAAPQRKGPGEQDALEADADATAVRAVVSLWSGAKGALAGMVQRALPQLTTRLRLQRCNGTSTPKTFPPGVHPTLALRQSRLALLGDGTAGNPGITFPQFQSYIAQQADWFVEPTLTGPDRARLWDLANLKEQTAGLAKLMLAELVAAAPADLVAIKAYAAGSAAAAQTVRITKPAPTVARAIELGKAMIDLVYVPGPVLRVCIEQATLEKLVDGHLLPVLKDYFARFKPTIENPDEQAPLLALLGTGLAPYAPLVGWIHDLHAFTSLTLTTLAANVTNTSRSKPVLLILHSGLDWNTAFLQASNLQDAVTNGANLALVLQGATSLAEETARVDKIADDYGQKPSPGAKGRLGQVVFAGHGQATTVEQATPGTGAKSRGDQTVEYDEEDLSPKALGDASYTLIDKVLTRMDPADARVVFAGCLVGSHDVADSPDLADPKKAAKAINDSIKANPNLADLVKQRMKALKVKGTVVAANASTQFDRFNVDLAGKAQMSSPDDPAIAGSKAEYVQTGVEPEGAMRAALETWADPKFGPTWTTNKMRKHVADVAASKDWDISLTRTAFKLALPASGNVNPQVINDLAHRVGDWGETGWIDSADPAGLARAVKPAEAPVVYPVMLVSDQVAGFPDLTTVVQEAWMSVDASHTASFRAALDATTLTRNKLTTLLDDSLINPKLATLLPTPSPAAPSQGQLRLALAIAVKRGSGMPAEVKTFLVGAAGGSTTTSFPAALGVPALLDGASELEILRNVGLAPGAQPDNANVDVDQDKTNETFVAVDPHQVTIVAPKDARAKPDATAPVLAGLTPGMTVQVVGASGTWTVVDVGGKIGFVDGNLP